MRDPQAGDQYGDWELVEFLGKGGNGWVWKARHRSTDESVAIKMLKQRKVDAEAYARFRREVATLVDLAGRPGILPVLEPWVPDRLAKGERAWFTMPLAEPIDTAMATAELREIVTAFATFADTLAGLQEDRRLAHRDLKPGNLYRWQDEFAVGDFGLVHLPEAESLTASGHFIAPANYVPWELLQDPAGADPAPADVYMLTKALWVVAANQRWPPPGPQPAGSNLSVGWFRPHPRAPVLDRVIERGTWMEPEGRLTMRQLEHELNTWLAMPEEPPEDTDLARLAAELRALTERQRGSESRDERWRQGHRDAYEFVEARLERLERAVSGSLPQVRLDTVDVQVHRQIGFYPTAGPQPMEEFDIGLWSTEVTPVVPLQLHLGVSLTLLDTGDLRVRGMISLGREGESVQDIDMTEELEAPVGGPDSQRDLETVLAALEEQLPSFARRFAEQLS